MVLFSRNVAILVNLGVHTAKIGSLALACEDVPLTTVSSTTLCLNKSPTSIKFLLEAVNNQAKG